MFGEKSKKKKKTSDETELAKKHICQVIALVIALGERSHKESSLYHDGTVVYLHMYSGVYFIKEEVGGQFRSLHEAWSWEHPQEYAGNALLNMFQVLVLDVLFLMNLAS